MIDKNSIQKEPAANHDYPSQWASDWPDTWSPGGSRGAKIWFAKRAAAWTEQNIERPSHENPYRGR